MPARSVLCHIIDTCPDDSMQLLSVAPATKWEIHRSDVIRDLGAGELLLKLLWGHLILDQATVRPIFSY